MNVFTEALSSEFRTITPDLRGYGRSQAHEPFTMQDHLRDLESLLDAHHIETCLVLGWSLGGILALEMAIAHPERIQGLVLVATAAHPRSSHPRTNWVDEVNTGIASLINWLSPGWQWNIETFGKRSLYRYLVQQHTSAVYHRFAQEALPAYWQTSKFARQALSQALANRYDRRHALPNITCPCLIMAAEQDYHITCEASLETANLLPNSHIQTYANVSHLFPWEISNQVIQDLKTWLRTETTQLTQA
jgi:proline iminopeptidase